MSLFVQEVNMLPEDFRLFKACNNGRKCWSLEQEFYAIKDVLLERYATKAGYAVQTIERYCGTCGGSGWCNYDTKCYDCTDGVSYTNKYYLKRYVLNGELFYKPVDSIDGLVVEEIRGYVPRPEPEVIPELAYAILLHKYFPEKMEGYLHHFKQHQLIFSSDWKRWGEIAHGAKDIREALILWFNSSVCATKDDLPF